MLFENWLFQLIGLIPQSVALVALGTAIVKELFTFRQIIFAALIISIVSFTVYQLPISYGLHIPLNIIIFILVLRFVLSLSILKSAMVSLMSFIILVVIELFVVLVQINLFNVSEDFFTTANDLQKFYVALPTLFILALISIVFQLFRRRQYRTQ